MLRSLLVMETMILRKIIWGGYHVAAYVALCLIFFIALSHDVPVCSEEEEALFLIKNRALSLYGDYSLDAELINPMLNEEGIAMVDSVATFKIGSDSGVLSGKSSTLYFFCDNEPLMRKAVEKFPCMLKYDFRGTRPGEYTLSFVVGGSHGDIGIGRLNVMVRHDQRSGKKK